MRILVWLTEGTWPACVDAAADLAPPGADITLLHVTDPGVAESLHGAFLGRLGRGGHGTDPGDTVEAAVRAAERTLLDAAVARLGRPAHTAATSGRAERLVVEACEAADLLILARDGDHSRPGPGSLGPATRFVVDHAPCRVLLLWPDAATSPRLLPPAG
ncbi:universal stress protein [Longispora sp. NPDC051575]|uniref:universal stress protein n=1 Tax=Longispora sp. NPDC051575 TaxID=3154943 RepID=UPI0034410E96